MDTQESGCPQCWPDDADAAWAARRALLPAATLVDESHYQVRVLGCAACGQRFLSVFTETVDWADGEDPQHWSMLPVDHDDLLALLRDGVPDESALAALAPRRRSLQRDFPKGGAPRCAWGVGLRVGPHD